MKLKRKVSLLLVLALIFSVFTSMPVTIAAGQEGEFLSEVTSEKELNEKFELTTGAYDAVNGPVASVVGAYDWRYADVKGKIVMPDEFNIRYTIASNNYHEADFYFNYSSEDSYYCLGKGKYVSNNRCLMSKTSEGEVVLATAEELGDVSASKDVLIQKLKKADGSFDIILTGMDNNSSFTVNDDRKIKPSGGYSRYYASSTGGGNIHAMDWSKMQGIKTISVDDSENKLKPVITAEFEMTPVFEASMIKIVNKETKLETDIELISENGNTIVFTPQTELGYDTVYYVRFSKDIQAPNGYGMVIDRDLEFKTAPSPIRYSAFYINGNVSEIGDLIDYEGQTVSLSFNIDNSIGIKTGFMATVAIENGDTLFASGTAQVSESDCDVNGGAYMEISGMDIPSDIPADAECRMYIWDSQERMQSLHPYTAPKADKENNITYLTAEDNGQVTIKGNLGQDSGFDKVTLLMFNPENDDAADKGAVQYIGETKADAAGGFTFEFNLNTDKFGYFTYYITSAGCTEPKSDKFYYATAEQKNDAVENTINTGDVTAEDVKAIADIIGYNNELFKICNVNFIAECINERLKNNAFSTEDAGAEYLAFVNEYMYVDAFNGGNIAYLYGADNEFLFGKYINLSDNEMYNDYESSLTDKGRENVRNYMVKKDAKGASDIEVLFDEAVMLNMINNRTDNSTSLASEALKALAEKYTEIEILTYENIGNKLSINTSLMSYSGAHESIAGFTEYFKNLCNDYLEETKYKDDSVYTYAFSAKDADDSQSDFTFENITSFNNDHLYWVSDGPREAGFVSKNDFQGDYSYSAHFYKNYQVARIKFNYQDSKNYYFFEIQGDTTLNIGKVQDGTETVLATATAKFSALTAAVTLTVDYDASGIIRGSITKDTTHKDAIVVYDTTFTSGKIGGCLIYTPGRMHNVKVSSYLSVINGNVLKKSQSGERIAVDEELKLYFNYDINPGTVDGNVYIEDEAGNRVSSAVELSENGKEITIIPSKALDYASDYYVVVKEGITMNKTTTSVVGERRYKLKTNEPAFSVLLDTEFDGGAKNANEKIGFSVDVNNETGSSVEHIVLVVLKDKDGNLINAKAFKDIADTVTGEFTLELALEAGGRLEYYVFNNTDSLKFVYPKQEIATVDGSLADGDVYVIQNENQINVIGYTKANDKVRLIVLDAGKTMENIADDDAVIYFSEFIADGTGRFEKVFTKEELGEGDHVLAIAPVSYSLAKNIMLKIFADTAINESVGNVNLNQSTVESVVEVLGIDAKLAGSVQSWSDIETAVDREIATNGNFATDDAGKEIRSFVNEKLLLDAFNTGDKNVIFRNGEYMYNHIISLEDISTTLSGTTSYEFYKSSMTDTGKGMVIDYLMNNNFASKEDLYKRFNEAVVLYGIKNCKMSGYGHIQNLLMQNGVHVNGLNIADYIAKRHSQTDYTIYNSTFSSISELNNSIIASIQEQPTVDRPTTSGGGGGGGGGGILASHITRSEVVPDSFSTACVFKDVKANMEWCIEAVNYLHEKEIILGDENGLFNPSNPITREEFIKIAVIAFELKNTVKPISGFADVVPGSWYENYITIAVQNGAINGYPDGTVGVGQKITREEVAAILYRLIGDNNEVSQQVLDVFTDNTMVSEYAREALSYMVSQNIISGRGNNILAPKEVCTRAEAAKIVYEIIKPAEKELTI